MRLTKQTNYCLRMLIYCAANGERLSRVNEIAQAYGVSNLFLSKLLKILVDGGLVISYRGRGGGIRLARPAREISLLEVVKLTEDNFAMAECFREEVADCPLLDHCALSSALREALDAFFAVLGRYTVADLVQTPDRISRLLGLHELPSPSPAA